MVDAEQIQLGNCVLQELCYKTDKNTKTIYKLDLKKKDIIFKAENIIKKYIQT